MNEFAIADRMIWQLATRCRNDDVLIVGVATPIATAAGLLARELLVPDLTLLVAASVDPGLHDIARPMLEADYVARNSVGSFGQAEVLDLLHRGGVTLQFVSPAQLDRLGRINVSAVQRADGSTLRLPGPLALPDVCCLVGRLVAYRATHSPRFLVDAVDFVTGLGSAELEVRAHAGLPGRGVLAAVTDKATLRFDPLTATVAIDSVAPSSTIEEVRAGCGFPLQLPAEPSPEDPIPAEALELLARVIDPHGIRGMEVPSTRSASAARLDGMLT